LRRRFVLGRRDFSVHCKRPPSPIKIAVFDFELDDFSGGAGIAGDNAADLTQLDLATSEARRLIAPVRAL
jgi:hypothetical protein